MPFISQIEITCGEGSILGSGAEMEMPVGCTRGWCLLHLAPRGVSGKEVVEQWGDGSDQEEG
eukprot:1708082-Pleurochrysis_carterae.AAC.1